MSHKTRPVMVWADIDEEIADTVAYLQTIPGIRTLYSCQGTIGEGGPNPYPAYISVTWDSEEVLNRLKSEFELSPPVDDPEWDWSNQWCNINPRSK